MSSKLPHQKKWTFVDGYLVSTAYTHACGLETMVFPADVDAQIVEGFFTTHVVGVDWENPVKKYTRHYKTIPEAELGHKETVKAIRKETIRQKGGQK